MADDARWYVVHTYSGYENKVAANIETVVENRKCRIKSSKSACPLKK